jgi:hypothetical protein
MEAVVMRRLPRIFLLALGASLSACAPHENAVAMQGNADGVMINYVGAIAGTIPLARQHCARYERVPVLRETKENYAIYACVRGNAAPGTHS